MNRALFLLTTIVLIATAYNDASAFWGDNDHKNPGGLDVASGYDVNTVVTVSGKVTTPPVKSAQGGQGQMIIATPQGPVIVLLGPWSYWERQAYTISTNQEISITGSRAQGKDGALYLFAQRLDNKSSGTALTLRMESGSPLWNRNGAGVGVGSGSGFGRTGGGGYGFRGGMGGMGGGGRR
ncbi:MAG: DNA-binding protein [Desulfuromonadaceae bacterium]|nr:DNA-binding protein [Desulfuromonadaceae bacterium]MDD5105755.1 DNA-binding protein [Desulfuromonadaceae bacterium]